jgi:hypothetical protein
LWCQLLLEFEPHDIEDPCRDLLGLGLRLRA